MGKHTARPAPVATARAAHPLVLECESPRSPNASNALGDRGGVGVPKSMKRGSSPSCTMVWLRRERRLFEPGICAPLAKTRTVAHDDKRRWRAPLEGDSFLPAAQATDAAGRPRDAITVAVASRGSDKSRACLLRRLRLNPNRRALSSCHMRDLQNGATHKREIPSPPHQRRQERVAEKIASEPFDLSLPAGSATARLVPYTIASTAASSDMRVLNSHHDPNPAYTGRAKVKNLDPNTPHRTEE